LQNSHQARLYPSYSTGSCVTTSLNSIASVEFTASRNAGMKNSVRIISTPTKRPCPALQLIVARSNFVSSENLYAFSQNWIDVGQEWIKLKYVKLRVAVASHLSPRVSLYGLHHGTPIPGSRCHDAMISERDGGPARTRTWDQGINEGHSSRKKPNPDPCLAQVKR